MPNTISVLLFIFNIVSIISLPAWPYSRNWNLTPAIIFGIINIILSAVLLIQLNNPSILN